MHRYRRVSHQQRRLRHADDLYQQHRRGRDVRSLPDRLRGNRRNGLRADTHRVDAIKRDTEPSIEQRCHDLRGQRCLGHADDHADSHGAEWRDDHNRQPSSRIGRRLDVTHAQSRRERDHDRCQPDRSPQPQLQRDSQPRLSGGVPQGQQHRRGRPLRLQRGGVERHARCRRLVRGQQRHRHRRRPGRQQRGQQRCRLRLHTQRQRVVATGLPQGQQHRRRRPVWSQRGGVGRHDRGWRLA